VVCHALCPCSIVQGADVFFQGTILCSVMTVQKYEENIVQGADVFFQGTILCSVTTVQTYEENIVQNQVRNKTQYKQGTLADTELTQVWRQIPL